MDAGKSLGTASKKYSVKIPGSRDHVRIVERESISGKTFVGNETESEIRDKFRLEVTYKKSADSLEKLAETNMLLFKERNGTRNCAGMSQKMKSLN